MAGVYRPRHPERTVLYRVLFHHFDRFLTEYEVRFERDVRFPVLMASMSAVFSGRSSRRSWSGISTAAIPAAALPASVARTVVRSGLCLTSGSFSRRLTAPRSRRYSIDMVRRGDSLPRAGIHRAAEKAISSRLVDSLLAVDNAFVDGVIVSDRNPILGHPDAEAGLYC